MSGRKRRHSSSTSEDSDSDSSSSSSDSPSPKKKSANSRTIGPQIPAGIELKDDVRKDDSFIGPMVPEALKEKLPGYKSGSDDEDCIGPMPFQGDADDISSTTNEIERRAQKMKSKMLGQVVSGSAFSLYV